MKQLVALFLLALPFGVSNVVAAIVGIGAALAYDKSPYAKNLLRAADKLCAALLRLGDGTRTVSAECGARSGCRFCALVCRFLDLVQPGHCAGAAKREGLL